MEPISPRLRYSLVGFVSLVSVLGGLLTLREPLWIDELHSLWTVQGQWSELAARATVGNQSPLWFYVLLLFQFVVSKGTATEIVLRLPSLICWGLAFGLATHWIVRTKKVATPSLVLSLLVGCALLWWDLLAWFYAIEARPYAAVLLCMMISSWAWTLSEHDVSTKRRMATIAVAVMFVVLAIYLHYTAIIGCIALILARYLLNLRGSENKLRLTASNLSILLSILVLSIPALWELLTIGARRQQWNSFAGQADWRAVWGVMPLAAWSGIAYVFLVIDRKWQRKQVSVIADAGQVGKDIQMILLASVICIAAVWLMAILEIAPLMHSRYVIAVYGWVWIATVVLLSRIRSMLLVFIAGALMVGLWSVTQGGPFILTARQPIVWQRHEDWPLAIRKLKDDWELHQASSVYFAPMLVETSSMNSFAKHAPEYLRFALDASVASMPGAELDDSFSRALLDARLLPNNPGLWKSLLHNDLNKGHVVYVLVRTQPYRIHEYLQKQIVNDDQMRQGMHAELIYGAGRLALYRFSKEE